MTVWRQYNGSSLRFLLPSIAPWLLGKALGSRKMAMRVIAAALAEWGAPRSAFLRRRFLDRLDEALLDGPGGDAEEPLIYAAVEIERLSPNDPVPSCLRALAGVLAEMRATSDSEAERQP
jgi:hypothetical protein